MYDLTPGGYDRLERLREEIRTNTTYDIGTDRKLNIYKKILEMDQVFGEGKKKIYVWTGGEKFEVLDIDFDEDTVEIEQYDEFGSNFISFEDIEAIELG
jgi:hypothetical protein